MNQDHPVSGEDPRIRFAGERTLLAWVRTGLAMMAFGFVVARFGVFLHEMAPLRPNVPAQSTGLSLWFGTALVVLGAAVNVLAALEHMFFLRRLDRGEPFRAPRWSLGVIVSAVLVLGGLFLAVFLMSLSS